MNTYSQYTPNNGLPWIALIVLALQLLLTANMTKAAEQSSVDQHASSFLADELFQASQHSGFVFSPKGNFLAFIKEQPTQYTIVISDLTKFRHVKKIVTGDTRPENLQWLNEHRLAFSAKGKLLGVNRNGTDYSVLLDNLEYKESNKEPLIGFYNSAYRNWHLIDRMDNDAANILVGSKDRNGYAYVHTLNLYTGELKELADGGRKRVTNWLVAKNGTIGMGVRTKKGNTTYMAKVDDNWSEYVPNTKHGISLSFNDSSYLDNRAIFEALSHDSDIVYLSENISKDRFRIVEYSLSKEAIINTILEDDTYDVGGSEEAASLLFNENTKKLAGIHYQRNKPVTHWFDPTLKELQKTLDQQHPNTINRIESWTRDMDKLLVTSFDNASRTTVNVYYPNKGKLALIADQSAATRDNTMGEQRSIRFNTRDGYELEGYLTLPPKASTNDKLPLIVMPHGGPWARDTWAYNGDEQFFAMNGYAILNVNFRGSAGYGQAHLKAGIKEFAGIMIDDIADGARWAIDNNIADANRVYIMGSSYGGYAALMSGVRYPELYKGIVANAAPIDLLTQFKHYKNNDFKFAYDYWSEAVGNPKKSKDYLKRISPKSHLAELSTPFLIFHGSEDNTVPVSHAKIAQKVLAKQGKSDQVIIIKDEGHGFKKSNNRLYYLEMALNHFSS